MPATAFAPAKINLFLHVGAPQADGYHPLRSLMAFADMGDRLSADPSAAMEVRVRGPNAHALDHEADNLVARAARALAAHVRTPLAPFRLTLEKLLPVAAGLGGGSSDAGAALRLLRELWGLTLSDAELEAVAASLGADGAACLFGRPVLAEGRGERLTPLAALPAIDAVLVNAGPGVSTAKVYGRFDAIGVFDVMDAHPEPPAFEDAIEAASWLATQRNDLEAAARLVEPSVGDVLDTLAGEPEALLARMSGSGGTCFALCASDIEAEALAERMESLAPDWWVRRCRLGGPWPDDT
ncbi:MAG: 4-(cytidine 5'-diphospho)-2-C-methyl-D-erythritol kinase [Phenylobacterium sp.]|uniref:4-(cytidine 5'-diphospho)-2-C-methyl-D-erythritol kinase n=1 Tax=Phenylobacterium sp. TaxID=1871053 RepID=UPI00273341E3|nr:4-(cytidine 5'-diphospho)-2-C-methyl-D-erythritol kinase [Phenylobacterium sp.]MDP3174038.1 4-(cytidine 5'-diphospho)-2-C-methyl-D-erythritol kinase [Phenylobacterium sp.]